MHIVVHADELQDLIDYYQDRGYFEELIGKYDGKFVVTLKKLQTVFINTVKKLMQISVKRTIGGSVRS